MLAYPNDTVLICLCHSDVRTALDITENWCATNDALRIRKESAFLAFSGETQVPCLQEPLSLEFRMFNNFSVYLTKRAS